MGWIECHGGDHSKQSNFFDCFMVSFPESGGVSPEPDSIPENYCFWTLLSVLRMTMPRSWQRHGQDTIQLTRPSKQFLPQRCRSTWQVQDGRDLTTGNHQFPFARRQRFWFRGDLFSFCGSETSIHLKAKDCCYRGDSLFWDSSPDWLGNFLR